MGERIITEWNTFQGTMGANCYINELTQGRRYFFRASSGNIKGWGRGYQKREIWVLPVFEIDETYLTNC